MEEKEKLYNEVVKTILLNIFSEREITDKKIFIWDFNEDSDIDRLYFNVAMIAADINKEPVYLQMPLFKFLKLKWKRRKVRKNLYWASPRIVKTIPKKDRTSTFTIMNYVCEHYSELTLVSFKDINDEFYGWME